MKNNHRGQILTRDDFTGAYRLRIFRNPQVKTVVIKCDTCVQASRRKPLTRQQFKRLYR